MSSELLTPLEARVVGVLTTPDRPKTVAGIGRAAGVADPKCNTDRILARPRVQRALAAVRDQFRQKTPEMFARRIEQHADSDDYRSSIAAIRLGAELMGQLGHARDRQTQPLINMVIQTSGGATSVSVSSGAGDAQGEPVCADND